MSGKLYRSRRSLTSSIYATTALPLRTDVLHDEALAYAEKLREAGVEVETYDVPGACHGFDADQGNAFVQGWLQKRVEFMRAML